MKKTTLRLAVIVSFLFAGSLSLAWYLGYSSGSSLPAGGNETIPFQTAKQYFDRYMQVAPYQFDGVVKALVVDIEQYNAMQSIIENSSGTAGFRIYYGIDDKNQFVRIVAGFDSQGLDNTSLMISAPSRMSGLCPPICDESGGSLGK